MHSHFRRFLSVLALFLLLTAALPADALAANAAGAEKAPVVIVLDPGHGGKSEGASYYGLKEKDLTLAVAQMTGYYLSQFEGVTVCLTRTGDTDVPLEERARLARDADADFFYSIHFNASDSHALYGSEVWVSAFGDYYAAGYQFADILLTNMQNQIGTYSRGCKTRLNSRGSDYYGVIRMCTAYGIPSCIIEHCYLDNSYDITRFLTPESIGQMAYQDAVSIAEYFGLSSASLGLDFSDYPKKECEAPACHMPDTTPPDFAIVAPVSADASARTATVAIHALDAESAVSYFSFSTDQGKTWSELIIYGGGPAIVTLPLSDPSDTITVAVYNQYDLFTVSNTIRPF